jgi:3-methyl-2-oxobutanoate hydroxymethyltransferase
MTRRRPTVADLRADKGRGQKTMLRYSTLDEAAAAEAAGIDIGSVPPDLVAHPRYREAAPSVFSMTGKAHPEAGTADDYLRFCGQMLQAGADALYCSGSLKTVATCPRNIPGVGHVSLVPSRATFTGGFRAVGKTAAGALTIYHDCRRLHEGAAFAEFRQDVTAGAFPEPRHLVGMNPRERDAFSAGIGG